jgi:hypothetical protein
VQHAFAMLNDVAQGDHTQWSIVYDITRATRVLSERGPRATVRWIDIDGLALDCNTAVSVVDINAPLSGDVVKALKPYSADANLKLVRSSFSKTPFLSGTSPELRDELANYPDATTCRDGDGARARK